MNRQLLFEYTKNKYGTAPEYPWARYPSYAVLRHQDNEKWYGIVMDVSKDKLGLQGTDVVDILDVKCDPVMIDMLRQSTGFLPGYHINKTNWLSILLDGTVSDEQILDLLDLSFQMTAKKKKQRLERYGLR
ncbi:MAG: MmcQ/YjbR family DNA-binding protein [Lachnospiraceae bacterium]|nr:MmcQ/YjbR family DNA-binding protein [Lachnospiraceae bacterium]